MKDRHIRIRIEQCLALAEASNCSRRKIAAMIFDPIRNVVLMDGYNGGPRGGGTLCAGTYCARDGLSGKDIEVVPSPTTPDMWSVFVKGLKHGTCLQYLEAAKAAQKLECPPIQSGTRMEVGCHHAEANAICNAAASGVCTKGAWMIVTGEPCLMCSKLIHHAGIEKVIVIEGGYVGENGLPYLMEHGVIVQRVDGPQDPRVVAGSISG